MKKLLPLLLLAPLLFSFCKTPLNGWCGSKCNAAGDEKKNTEMVHEMETSGTVPTDGPLVFPLRIAVVVNPAYPVYVPEASVRNTIDILNKGFRQAAVQFEILRIDTLFSPYKIADLQADGYELYRQFSQENDLPATISLFFFDYERDLCKQQGSSISCSRTGGFSYILSEATNNVVLSKFDLDDHKIIVHEFGHFFGLYHTFEDYQFGKESADGSNADSTGDHIADTPADPGSIYEVYVNYSRCEMVGNTDPETGKEFRPLVNNYMAYYRPCYLTPYTFTLEQIDFMKMAARTEMRRVFAR